MPHTPLLCITVVRPPGRATNFDIVTENVRMCGRAGARASTSKFVKLSKTRFSIHRRHRRMPVRNEQRLRRRFHPNNATPELNPTRPLPIEPLTIRAQQSAPWIQRHPNSSYLLEQNNRYATFFQTQNRPKFSTKWVLVPGSSRKVGRRKNCRVHASDHFETVFGEVFGRFRCCFLGEK